MNQQLLFEASWLRKILIIRNLIIGWVLFHLAQFLC